MSKNGQIALSRDAERAAAQAREAEANAKRRARIEEAREFCRPFMPDHLDAAAMSLMLLREQHGVGNVTRSMVRERVRQAYPWIDETGETA